MPERVIGVILAGGKSSRMGTDKATLLFKGQNMVAHMAGVLRETGLKDIIISGPSSFGSGLTYIDDPESDRHQGPARAIVNCLGYFPRGKWALFVPVDMPLLDSECLRKLLSVGSASCFSGKPLPVLIRNSSSAPGSVKSVRDIMSLYSVKEVPLDSEAEKEKMLNTNTPEEWKKGLSYEHKI